MEHHPHPRADLLTFGVTVMAGSLPFWFLASGAGDELPGGLPISALMFVVPGLAAVAMTGRRGGTDAIRSLLRRLVRFGVSPRHWILPVSLGLLPVLMVVAAVGVRVSDPGDGLRVDTGQATAMMSAFLIAAALEELGWTAYALAPARAMFGDVGAGFGIGVAWAAWHVVPYVQAGHGFAWILAQCVATVSFRVIMVRIYIGTAGGTAAVVVFHALTNAVLIPNDGSAYDPLLLAPAVIALALAMTWVAGGPAAPVNR